MNKAELIKAIANFPDDAQIVVEIDSDDGDKAKTLQAETLFVASTAKGEILIHNDAEFAASVKTLSIKWTF